jgi:hypothetical protein
MLLYYHIFFFDMASDDEIDREWLANLRRVQENDPNTTAFTMSGAYNERVHQNLTDEGWEQLGQDIADNTHLVTLCLYGDAIDDNEMSFLFRELTRSNSITEISLFRNGLSVAGVRSMVPFLQNANNLEQLCLDENNIRSEGINVLFRALRGSPIEMLSCNRCGIESIEIDINDIPRHLRVLRLNENSIDADGCRELAKLLQGRDATLTALWLDDNKIDDEGVAILVNALKNNTTLEQIYFIDNEGITVEGMRMLLKLVNDISSVEATLQSNRTLLKLDVLYFIDDINWQYQQQINYALEANYYEDAGREKVILTQLHSGTREKLASLQGEDRSLFSEINPLHLPEVLALVAQHHDQEELYVALKSSIAGVISTVNRKECIQQQRAYYAAKLEELDAELAIIEESEGHAVEIGSESRSNKRRRKWWWGLWGGA